MKRLVLIIATASAAACGGSSTSPSVTTPSGPLVIENFSGVVQPLGKKVHTFTVATPGQLSVTMTAAGPPPTITMGLSVGNPDSNGNCISVTGTTPAIASATTPQLSGTVTVSGAYCVEIDEVGNAAGPITYSITVSHT